MCLFRYVLIGCAFSALLACESSHVPQSKADASAAVAEQAAPHALVTPSAAPAKSNGMAIEKTSSRALYGATASKIENALREFGWSPIGNRVGLVKGVQCTTVLAKRDGMNAEVKSFTGYPYGLQDMLELKDTAQGLGEMVMITVIVKGDKAKTDELYEQLMGSAPVRHGSGLGLHADSSAHQFPNAAQSSTSSTNSELAPVPLPSIAPSPEVHSEHTINRVTHCCSALRQNAGNAPPKMSQKYKAAAAICDKVVVQNLLENEKLARVREPLVNAPIPATCKDKDDAR